MARMNIANSDIKPHILTGLKEGNLNAFKELFFQYQPKLHGFVFRYLKSKTDAEEIVQEVFIQIWENRTSINENLSFNSFLFTITKNKIIDYLRKKKTETLYRNYVFNYLELINDSTDKELMYKDYNEALADAITQLPKKRRAIFIMSKKFQMSRTEIAQFLDISENTVKNQLQDAMNFIRTMLNKEILLLFLIIINYLSELYI
jgi:RNA polymerase sigma-70 factor (ECF subfamily)